MKKNYLSILAILLVSQGAFAQTHNAAPYCTPVFGNAAGVAGITAIVYNSNTNNSAAQNNTYTFYNNLPDYTVTGGTPVFYNVTADQGTRMKTLSLVADVNKDNAFDVYSEVLASHTFSGGVGSYSLSGMIPDTTAIGPVRVRIMWVDDIQPCQSNTATPYEGEVEDYQIMVSSAKAIPRINNATGLTGSHAVLQGTVNANGSTATVDFEYGQTTSYTNSITGGSVTANAHTPVSAYLSNLTPNTIYHYRIKSTNASGTSYSPDLTFVTTSGVGIHNTSTGSYTVAPNPGNGFIKINGLASAHTYTAEVLDITGRKVFSGTMAEDHSLHLEQLTKGNYLIRITDKQLTSVIFPISTITIQ